MYPLYGDGIHDDTQAIQQMLDSGISQVVLPAPQKHYCISATLKIHSNQTLTVGETTTIRLLPQSNCPMLTNAETDAHDIVITGGIWDYDNVNQKGNRIRLEPGWWDTVSHGDKNYDKVVDYAGIGYMGVIMTFDHVTRFSIRNVTLKNPVTYCLRMAYMTYFTVENIRFDQNLGNPTAENMDGVHIDGGCRFGSIRNVQGTCYDDVVALNANDCWDGDIQDIQVDGVFCKDALRGVRLLAVLNKIERVSVSNVFGTFYQNAVAVSYFYPKTGIRATMSHISFRNIYAQHAPRIPAYRKGTDRYNFAQLWIDGELDIDQLTIDNLCRNEQLGRVETLKVCQGARIRALALSNVVHQNHTGTPIPLMTNQGEIEKLYLYNVDSGADVLLNNEGTIGKIIEH